MKEANRCLVECRWADGHLAGREPYRRDHLNLLRRAQAAGTVFLAGARSEPAEPADRLILIWTHREPADGFIAADPTPFRRGCHRVLRSPVGGWRRRRDRTTP